MFGSHKYVSGLKLSLFLLIFNVTLAVSCNNTVDLSTPESTAKAFWNVLQTRDVDKALTFFVSVKEAQQFLGVRAGLEWGNKLDREVEQLRLEHIPDVEGGKWSRFEIDDEEYESGIKIVEASIYYQKEGQEQRIRLGIIRLEENLWKISDVD